MIRSPLCILAAFSVLGCDDPAIPVPVEFEIAEAVGRTPGVDSVTSTLFVGEDLVVGGVIWFHCERFSAVASEWNGDRRATVTLFVESEPNTDERCYTSAYLRPPTSWRPLRYTATIQVEQPVTASLIAWEVRVYHRGTRLPVPPWGPNHHISSLGLER